MGLTFGEEHRFEECCRVRNNSYGSVPKKGQAYEGVLGLREHINAKASRSVLAAGELRDAILLDSPGNV